MPIVYIHTHTHTHVSTNHENLDPSIMLLRFNSRKIRTRLCEKKKKKNDSIRKRKRELKLKKMYSSFLVFCLHMQSMQDTLFVSIIFYSFLLFIFIFFFNNYSVIYQDIRTQWDHFAVYTVDFQCNCCYTNGVSIQTEKKKKS